MKPIVTIIGGGAMGQGIASLLLNKSYPVHLVEPNEETRARLAKTFHKESAQQQLKLLGKVRQSDSAFVIEAVPEIVELKKHVLTGLEETFSDDVIILSNTSGIPINELASHLRNKSRFMGLHFFTPAEVNPVVEIIQNVETTAVTVEKVKGLIRDVEKVPITIYKDIPGFVGNRIQHAMAREAIHLVEQGIASVEDIDLIVRLALAPRLTLAGPLLQRDINGLDTHLNIAKYLYKDLSNQHAPSPLLVNKVNEGKLGMKSGEGFYEWDETTSEEFMEKYKEQLFDIYNQMNPKS